MMKPLFFFVLFVLFLPGCKRQVSDVNYSLTDEQLSRLMFDVQLSEVALSEVTGGRKDSLRNVIWKRMTEVYKHTEPEIKDEIRKLEGDPKKMKFIMDQVQALSDSIQ